MIETGKNAQIITYKGITPTIHESVFLCSGAVILGDVEIGEDSSIWYNCVIRGDVHYIRIGKRTNIQDLSMLHVTHKKYPLNIGDSVTIGHSAVLHGCTIKDLTLIGMGAKVLDQAVVESYSLVAAGTVVPERFVVPSGTLVAGVPAKVVRDLREEELQRFDQSAQNYVDYVREYRSQI